MITIEDVKRLLPQRYPFLMVDRVVDVKEGESIVAIKNVSINEPFFQGHFPNKAVMPGVMLIEAMAQAAGILGLVTRGKDSNGFLYLLCGAERTRFRRQVIPGDQVELIARFVTTKRNILKYDCEARVDGDIVASTQLTIAEQVLDDQQDMIEE